MNRKIILPKPTKGLTVLIQVFKILENKNLLESRYK